MGISVAVWLTRLDSANIEIHPVSLPANIASLDEASTSLPGGAYTTLRTYQRDRILPLKDQLQRLEQSARLAGTPIQLDEDRLRFALRSAIARVREQFQQTPSTASQSADLRLRLTLDLESNPGDLYIASEPLDVPPTGAYLEGVSIVTCTLKRLLPEAKLTRFLARSRPIRQSLPVGINEAVMVDAQGFLLEGLTSNFFAISQGEIHTAGEAVLAGITRGLTLECARRLEIPVRLQAVHMSDLTSLQEAFLTSSSRGVLPVCRIDAIRIGSGKPGPLTRWLMQVYDELIEEKIEQV
jgi:branched-chain amino acid aminotransferase